MWLRTPKASLVNLDSNLGFVTDMRVILYNIEDSYFGGTKSTILGQFLVPITSITTLYNYPQYFNFVDEQGNLVGRVLARFYIVQKSQQMDDRKEREVRKRINEFIIRRCKFDLQISILGLRNLVLSMQLKDLYGMERKHQIRIQLTNHVAALQNNEEQYPRQSIIDRNQTIEETEGEFDAVFPKVLDAEESNFTCEPNFCEILQVKGIEFAEEPLLWPFLQIDVLDSQNPSIVLSRCLIPLFSCAKSMFEVESKLRQIKFTMAMFKAIGNPTSDSVFRAEQLQMNPATIFYQAMKERSKQGEKDRLFSNDISIDEDLVELSNASDNSRVIENNLEQDLGAMRQSFKDEEANNRRAHNLNHPFQQQVGYFSPSDEDDERLTLNEQKQEEQQQLVQQKSTMFSDAEDDPYVVQNHTKIYDQEMTCSEDDLRLQLTRVKNEKKKQRKLLKKLKLVYEQVNKKKILELKETVRNQEMLIRRQVEELVQNINMTEERFLGFQSEQLANQFDVGDREMLKSGTREDQLYAPFRNYPLLSYQTGWHTSAQAYDFVDQVYRAGRVNGSFIRAKVLLEKSQEGFEDKLPRVDQSDSDQEADLEFQNQNVLTQESSLEEVYRWAKSRSYLFDILNRNHLESISSLDRQEFKVRVYIMSCQNLAAVDSFVEWNNMLAGESALSSANAYPVIKIGKGDNSTNQQHVKYIDEKHKPVLRDLNPQFYRVYELDAQFPDDWQLEIEIRDKRYLPSSVDFGLFDTLIGKTVIDLEQRWFGDQYNQIREVTQIEMQRLQEKKKDKEEELRRVMRETDKARKLRLQLEKMNRQIDQTKLAERIIKESARPLEPIEFRELKHPEKKQAQGIIQMWCEVLNLEDSRNQSIIKFEQEKQDENYEVRLIIWETREIPLSDGDSVDIFVKAIFCAESLNDNTVEKQTDVHNASSDGRGIFNYRMKFNLHMPADFPRIKLQVYDKNALSGDICLGECMLNIRNTVMLFQKHGKIDLKKVWASVTNPNNSNEATGFVLISVQLLTQADANSNPVGEAQEDPNEDPKLQKPTEGRGYAAALQGMGFRLPNITLPSFDMFKKILIVVIVLVVLGCIGFLLMYFKK